MTIAIEEKLDEVLKLLMSVAESHKIQIEGLIKTAEYLIKCIDALESRVSELERRLSDENR